MKKILALILALAAPLVATVARADDDDDHHRHDRAHYRGTEFTVWVGGGLFVGDTLQEGDSPVFDQGVHISEAFLGEIGFGVIPIPWLEVGASASFTASSFTVKGESGLFGSRGTVTLANVDIWHYTADARFHFLPRAEKFDPYVLLGAGAATYNSDISSVSADTKFALSVGSGFNVWFTDEVGMKVEAKDLVTVLDVNSNYDYQCECYHDYGSSTNTLNNVALTSALTVRWH